MEVLAPVVHDTGKCFICLQYRFYLEQYCRENNIAIEFAACPFAAALLETCKGNKVLVINNEACLMEWLPKAYELFGLPCLNFDLMDGSTHLGQFLSLN